MTNTELHEKDLLLARTKQELEYYKASDKYRSNVVKAMVMISILSTLTAIAGWLL